MKFNPVLRIRFLAGLVIVFFLVLVVRLFFLQVIKNSYYRDMADRQYTRPAGQTFDRGNIYFSSKDGSLVSAATVKMGFTVAINPKITSSATTTFSKLSPLFIQAGIPLDQDAFMAKANKKDDPYEEIANRVPETLANNITALNLKNLAVSRERWRYYPAGVTASHAIGLMGYKGDDYTGRYGLESSYDDVLSRTADQSFVNFFAQIFRGLGTDATATTSERAEGDIVLTIEPKVQNYLEDTLLKTKDFYSAESTGGIIINPQTGAILAMAALPNFNPGEKQASLSSLSNPMVENIYEMGSIVKALTMGAGLDSGAVTAKTTYNDTGCIVLNKKKICNYDLKARGVIPMQEVLNQSLNVGATFVETQMGKETFRRYFMNYGLGEKTGIDLPNEATGLISTLNNNQDVEFATASFGQGISVSPIEITRALSTLANGGRLIRPYLVKEIRYKTGIVKTIEPQVVRQVLATSTSREISRMLTVVVDTKLANGKVKLEHTSIAAKTGTAQMVDPSTRKYYPDRYLHSFFGYFPASNPKFLVFLFIKHPLGVQYASETLTNPFMDITKFLLNYYNVPPDR